MMTKSQNFFPNTILKNVFTNIFKSNHHDQCSK